MVDLSGFLSSVEFLDLGSDLQLTSSKLKRKQWRSLPDLKHTGESNNLLLVDSVNYVHAVGDDVVESFNKKTARWSRNRYKPAKNKSFAVAVSNVPTNSDNLC